MDGQWVGGNAMGPFGPLVHVDEDTYQLKLAHDRYDVYVNEDLVGQKVLLTQVEHIQDVEKYLKQAGFREFTTDLIGDHFNIHASEPNEAHRMKEQLQTYLNIR